MIIHDVAQLSPEWWELRRGVPTASDFHRIIKASTGEASKSQEPYIAQLIKDIQCQSPNYFTDQGKPVNVHLQRGRNIEEEALAWYSMVHKVNIRRVGFVTTDDGRFGCSPDGLIIDSRGRPVAGVEVKCPSVDKHDKHVREGTLPMEYKAQTNGCTLICGLPYWVFLQYNPDSATPTLCLKIFWNDFTDRLKQELELFWTKFKDAKRKAGVVSNEEILEAWDKKLAQRPDAPLLNSWLPELSQIAYEPCKRQCWALIQAYAKGAGWEFDKSVRQWKQSVLA